MPVPSDPEANKAIIRRLHGEFESDGRMEVADAILSPTLRTSRRPDRASGPAGAKAHLAMLRRAFPDFRVTIEALVAEGELVSAYLTMRDTHMGPFRGRAPTRRLVLWTGMVLYRVRDGKIVEQWGHYDTAAIIARITAG